MGALFNGILFCVLCCNVTCQPKVSTSNSEVPGHKIDVILISYSVENVNTKLSEQTLEKMRLSGIPCNRAITYPDGYVPVLIPKEEVDNIRRILKNRFLELSPALK
jgi:hypothetical protein